MFHNLLEYSNNTAIITELGEEISYGQLQLDVDCLKHYLSSQKLAVCLCTNTLPSIVGYIALIQSHSPTILLDAGKDKNLLERYLQTYFPNYIWAPKDRCLGKICYEYKGYALFEYSTSKIIIHSDLLLLLTTSGSTGSPKLVRLTDKNLMSNTDSIIKYLEIDCHERAITSLPMYYSFGMSVINSHLRAGASLILTNANIIQKEFWSLFKGQYATSLAGVPYTFEMLKRLRFFNMQLPYLKTMTQAGGKLNSDIAKEYMEYAQSTGKKFVVMYGQTEAAPRMSYLPCEKALEKPSSIGIAIPGGEFSLLDEDGKEILEPNTDGELVYKGANVCMGYAESLADLSLGDENHGILLTGDIARRDMDGFYYITGRKKRFVKVWGNRCNLDGIEQLLKGKVSECACVGEDDSISVFVTEQGIETKIAQWLAEKTKLHVSAFHVWYIKEIPKNNSGKILYVELMRQNNEDKDI